jgi:hypothetical protein
MQNLTSLTQSSAGNVTCAKNFTVTGTTTMNGTVDLTGATVTGMTATASAVAPDADDGAALGTTALKWSDLFLASGAVINFNNGNVTLTHSAGTLTMSADQFVLGAFSSATAGSGNALSSTVTGTMKIYGDDAGAAMTGNIRNFLSRVLLTVDHPGDLSVRGAMGQIKLNDGVDLTQGYANGVEGYIEMAGTNNIGASSNVAAVSGIVELTTASTITSGGSLAGVIASYSSTAVPTGNCAGFMTQIKNTAKWPIGLYIPASTATQGINVGAFSSATSGSGIVLSSSITSANRFYADDGGVALSGTDLRNVIVRTLITTAIVDTDLTVSSLVGQIKHGAVDSKANTSYMAGVRGYFEIAAGGTIYNATAVRACVELPETAVIASGGILSGVLIDAVTLAGTHTGKATCIHVPSPGAGEWDYLMEIPTELSGDANGVGTDVYIPITINGTAARITAKYVS